MPRLIVNTRDNAERTFAGPSGLSVMEILRDNGIDEMLALCGGSCSCATCHIYVDLAFRELLPALGTDESELLDASPHRQSTSRLSCQIRLTDNLDGLKITIAPED